jgi:signal transduction histidine kinase
MPPCKSKICGTPDIGLRNRFFWIIFFVLSVALISTSSLYEYVLKQERLQLIDRQIRDAASILLDSDLVALRTIDFHRVEEILNQELGEDRIGKFFIIRNANDEVLFQSLSAKLLPIKNIPRNEQWVSYKNHDQFIRVLNLNLPKIPDRSLQVGFVIDENILSSDFLSNDKLLFIFFIFLAGITVSWFLARKLLQPISVLSDYIDRLAENKDGRLELPQLPPSISSLTKNGAKNDDFKKLVSSFEKLTDRVNKGYKLSRFWSYQMAHELKTPMAVIEAITSDAARRAKIDDETAKKIVAEVLLVSDTISSFLNWAEVENTGSPTTLHVNRVSKTIDALLARLQATYPHRIELRLHQDFSIYSNMQQLEQMLSNLIINACDYSSQKVIIDVDTHKISIIDSGDGFSQNVLDRLGEPFNSGGLTTTSGNSGSGLGLAYVKSVCHLYNWELHIESSSNGSTIYLKFPELNLLDPQL